MKALGIFIVFLTNFFPVAGQVSVTMDGSPPDSSAMLDLKSHSKGFKPPAMTFNEILNIHSPAPGLIAYCLDCGISGEGSLMVCINGTWMILNSCAPPNPPDPGKTLSYPTKIDWKWDSVPGATGYKWNTVNSCVSAVDVGNCRIKTETGLACDSVYERFVWAYNSCGRSEASALKDTTLTQAVSNELRLWTGVGEEQMDELVVRFIEGSTTFFDDEYDSYKLFGIQPLQIYSKTQDNINTAINSIPITSSFSIVSVSILVLTPGTYKITGHQLNTFTSGFTLLLEDLKINYIHDLKADSAYTFEAGTTDDPDRFILLFSNVTYCFMEDKMNLSQSFKTGQMLLPEFNQRKSAKIFPYGRLNL
jgi:hypothetical protein